VFVDPRARDPEFGRKCRRVDKSADRGGALAAHQLDYSSCNGLHGSRVECGVGLGALKVVVERWAVVLGHRC
jgi:hypothetical protein